MLFDINLRSSIDRSNDTRIDLITEPTFKENSMLWHKGGLSPIYYNEYQNVYLDAYENEIAVYNGMIHVNGNWVYSPTRTIGKPIKGKFRYQNDNFVDEPGQFPIHGASFDYIIENNQLRNHNINTNAEFFWDASSNVIYEIEQGSNTNRFYNPQNDTWSQTSFNFAAINNGRLIFTRNENASTSYGANELSVMIVGLNENVYQTLSRPQDRRCYSAAVGPGFSIIFWTHLNDIVCQWVNQSRNAEWFYCNNLRVGNTMYLPYDGIVTDLPLQGIQDSRRFVSNIANSFSYTTGNFIVYRGTNAALENESGIITGPAATFSRMHSSGSAHLYGDDNGNYYRVPLNVPTEITKMSEYVMQINDGTTLVSTNGNVTVQPKVSTNFGYFTPYIERSAITNSNQGTAIFAASNNANYELGDIRGIGGIVPQFTMNYNGVMPADLSINGNASIGYNYGDYYISQLSAGAARYQFSISDRKYINTKLVDIIYPNTSDPIYPIPVNATRIRTRTPNVLFKWADVITATGIVNNNRTMLAYRLLSNFYGAETFFFLLKNYYLFDGENIYDSNTNPGNAAWNGSISAIAEGLRFLSADSQQALFYSDQDGWIYAYTGDYRINPIIDTSNTSIIDSVYCPSLDLHAFLTNSECLLLCKGQLSSIKGNWISLDTTLKGLILYGTNSVTKLSLYDVGNTKTNLLESNYLQLKEGMASHFNDIWFKLKKVDANKIKIKFTSNCLLTLDKELTKTATQEINFDEGKDFKVIKFPLASNGRALAFKIESDDNYQINAITLDAEAISKSAIKANQTMV